MGTVGSEPGNARVETAVGAVAQLGERLVCNQEATGSIPVSSTKITNSMLGVSAGWHRILGWRNFGIVHDPK